LIGDPGHRRTVFGLPAPIAGALWMIVSCIAFGFMWVLIRLTSTEMHPFVIVVWRNALGLLWLLPMLLASPGLLRRERFVPNLRRAFWSVIATFSLFFAVARAPLADVLAISFASPLFATLGAMLFLGEKVGPVRAGALIGGMAGVLIVLRPGATPLGAGIFGALSAAIATAGSVLVLRRLASIEDPRAITVWSFLILLPVSIVIALPFWQWPSRHLWPLLVGIGACAASGQLSMSRALALAEASSLMPLDFVRFALVTIAGVWLFGERWDWMTIAGGGVILASTTLLVAREHRRR
jgi:drug/metabolite transporter (DMT)-like permease